MKDVGSAVLLVEFVEGSVSLLVARFCGVAFNVRTPLLNVWGREAQRRIQMNVRAKSLLRLAGCRLNS
jgi:hypothetical protein